eukprot:14680667-Alexandrium_andersonii.AAC.1
MFVGVLASFEEALACAIADTDLSFTSGTSMRLVCASHAPLRVPLRPQLPGLREFHSGLSVRQWSE